MHGTIARCGWRPRTSPRVARADGSQPRDPDGLTLAPVGDRTVVTGELSGDAAETVTHAISVFTPRPTDLPDLLPAQRRALALDADL